MPRRNRFNKRSNPHKVEHYHFYPQYSYQSYQPRAMGNGWYCVLSPNGEDFYYHTSWLINRSRYQSLFNMPPLYRSSGINTNRQDNMPADNQKCQYILQYAMSIDVYF